MPVDYDNDGNIRAHNITALGTIDAPALNISGSAFARANLAAETTTYTLPPSSAKTWDALQTNIPGTAANDDLALITGTFLTSAATFRTSDAKAAVVSQKLGIFFSVPPEYVAGAALALRLNAGMVTTVSDGTATIDAEVVRAIAPTVDICATTLTTINSLTAANKDFTLTPTNVVPGDLLYIVVTIAITDAATVTAVIGQLNRIQILASVKG